jgi:hypothetical protein
MSESEIQERLNGITEYSANLFISFFSKDEHRNRQKESDKTDEKKDDVDYCRE